MTLEQKAVIIATRDGWEKPASHSTFYRNGYRHLKNFELTKYYLTDLNYLMPVAVKVYDALGNSYYRGDGRDLYENLHIKVMTAHKTSEGTYQPLFDAVYEAIVYLKNQNK